MPKLSVIVPVYNTEKYLRECIDSILAQIFTDFELILVDDGSTDKSGAICDEYALLDQRIYVTHQQNAGVTRARKVGAALAKGDYVTYVDSDDWIDTDAYSNMMLNIEKNNTDMGIFAMVREKISSVVVTNCVGEGVFSKEMLQKTIYPKMLFDYSLNRGALIASLWNKIIRREILQKAIAAIPDYLDYGEDAISGYLCMLNAFTVYICNDPYYHYRDNPSSNSHAKSSVMKKRILALDLEMRRCFAEYDANILSQIAGHIARHTVELVRKDLIYLTDIPFSKRCRAICDFCEQPQIAFTLEKAYHNICDKKEKIKVFLIRRKLFGLLYFLFKKA